MNLYDTMIAAIREHWKAHDNHMPQHFQLTEIAHRALNETRALVNQTMNFRQAPGWENEFQGVKIVRGDSNQMVSKDGAVVQLG